MKQPRTPRTGPRTGPASYPQTAKMPVSIFSHASSLRAAQSVPPPSESAGRLVPMTGRKPPKPARARFELKAADGAFLALALGALAVMWWAGR